jgi:hypothetical protein
MLLRRHCPYKGQLEVWYKQNQSLLVDVALIILTAWVIIAPNNRSYETVFKNLPKCPETLLLKPDVVAKQ